MSYFLQNLIERHQEVGVNRELSQTVQPRLKARFETDSGAELFVPSDTPRPVDFKQTPQSGLEDSSSLSHSVQNTESIMTDISRQTPQAVQNPIEHIIDKAVIQPNFSHRLDDLNERITAIKIQLGRKSSVQDTPSVRATENQTGILREFPEIAHPSIEQQEDINLRTQSLLQRLNTQQAQHTEDQKANSTPRESALSSSDNSLMGAVQARLNSNTATDFTQATPKLDNQNRQNRTEQRELHQAGFLQIPSWLTDMQTDLTVRWRELNKPSSVEPVINVTIGRVEVRAMNAESAPANRVQNKPTGVLSLDDYLKQRDSKGRT